MLTSLLVGCGGGSAASSRPPASVLAASVAPSASDGGPTQAPRTVTPADDGRTYAMHVGDTAELVVGDPSAPDPVVDGASVNVVEVVNIDASGQREWELRAVAPGRTVVSSGGSKPYAVTFDVVLR